jgi:glutamyl-tRNA synthetase
MKLDAAGFADAAERFVVAEGLPVPGDFTAIAAAVQEKVRLLSEVPDAVGFLLCDDFSYDGEALAKVRGNAHAKQVFTALAGAFAACGDWSADHARNLLAEAAMAAGVKPGQLMFPLRVALSGRGQGPDLGAILALLGRDRCAVRLRAMAAML